MALKGTIDENGLIVYVTETPTAKRGALVNKPKRAKPKQSKRKSNKRKSTGHHVGLQSVMTRDPNLTTTGKSGREMVKCPVCHSQVRSDHLGRHLQRSHLAKQVSDNHYDLVYPIEGTRRSSAQEQPPDTPPSTEMGERKRESFRQSFDEPRYGDKYLGQVRHESDGKFGSIPLYDDYSEESGPD